LPAESASPPSVAVVLARALELHGAGRVGEAMPLYAQILARERDHSDALHLIGVAHIDLGHP
jgi:hypothetical protein